MEATAPSEAVPPAAGAGEGKATKKGTRSAGEERARTSAHGSDAKSSDQQGGTPAAQPPPRVAALFEAALAEGVLQEREAAGMMKGVIAQISSGKKTEDAMIAQTTKTIQGMRQKAAKKRQQAEKKAANKKLQAEAKRQREAAVPAPAELLNQLANTDEAKQLLAAKSIASALLKLKSKQQRDFQDAMVPALDSLVTMAQSEQEARRTTAFDALHRLLMYHRLGCATAAKTTVISTITKILQNRERALQPLCKAKPVYLPLSTTAMARYLYPFLTHSLTRLNVMLNRSLVGATYTRFQRAQHDCDQLQGLACPDGGRWRHSSHDRLRP